MDDTITTDALSGAEPNNGTAAADGNVAGSETAAPPVELKDLLKEVLKKDFPTNEAAIKSLQDTYAYVGKAGQEVKTLTEAKTELEAKVVTPELLATVETLQAQVRDGNFFAANPQYATPEAKSLIAKFGGNPEEVVKDEVFVKAFGALTKTAEMEQSQSVLHSNPRLGQVQDNMTKAVEAQKAGNQSGAANAAVAAVLEAYAK
jgi:hypothetical protein